MQDNYNIIINNNNNIKNITKNITNNIKRGTGLEYSYLMLSCPSVSCPVVNWPQFIQWQVGCGELATMSCPRPKPIW